MNADYEGLTLKMVTHLPEDPPSTDPICLQNRGNTGLAIAWILLTIGIIVVGLRVYVKLWVRRSHWWDDYTAVAALVSLKPVESPIRVGSDCA